jgi:hypothetical protein
MLSLYQKLPSATKTLLEFYHLSPDWRGEQEKMKSDQVSKKSCRILLSQNLTEKTFSYLKPTVQLSLSIGNHYFISINPTHPTTKHQEITYEKKTQNIGERSPAAPAFLPRRYGNWKYRISASSL